MATNEDRIFNRLSMTGMVESFAGNALDNVMRSKFAPLTGGELAKPDGLVEWDEVQFGRGMAGVSGKGAPTVSVNTTTVTRNAKPLHVAVDVDLKPAKLYSDRDAGQMQPDAQGYVDRQLENGVSQIVKRVEKAAHQALLGSIANIAGVDQSTFTYTYGVNTYTASASWATAGTDILGSELRLLREDCVQTSGHLPAEVYIRGAAEGYIRGNTGVTNLLSDNAKDALRTAGTFQGMTLNGQRFGNLDWFTNDAGAVISGTYTEYQPTDDVAIVLPSPDVQRNVLGMALGRTFQPSGAGLATLSASEAGVAGSAAAASMVVPTSPGWYAYAMRVLLPGEAMRIVVRIGWLGLPVLLQPNAVCVADLIP